MDSGYSTFIGSCDQSTNSSPPISNNNITMMDQHHQSMSASPQSNCSNIQYTNFNDTNVMFSPQYFDAQQQQQQVTITYPYSTPSLVQQTVSIDNTFKEMIPELQLKPMLEIVEQPADKPFRFRYKSEMHGTHGSLMGIKNERSRRTYPSVALRNFNFPGKTVIRCSLYQVLDGGSNGLRSPHSHKLVIRRGDVEETDPHDFDISRSNDYTAVFQGMGIIHTAKRYIKNELFKKKKAEKEFEFFPVQLTQSEINELDREAERETKIMNLNQVCLCFQAYYRNDAGNRWEKICEPVYSNTINNMKSALTGELRITRMSSMASLAAGGEEIFLFVEKVCKNNIKVRFYENSDNQDNYWEDYAIFNETDVHHQYGIVLKTPPYKDQSIQTSVTVYIQLYRPSDQSQSEPIEFRYKPNLHPSRKRPRPNPNENIPTVIPGSDSNSQNSFSGVNGGSNACYQQDHFGKQNLGNGSQEMHDDSMFQQDQTLLFGSFTAHDITISDLDLKGLWNASTEQFFDLLDVNIGDMSIPDSKLRLDGPNSCNFTPAAITDQSQDINCSVLDKVKMLIKLFKNNYDGKKLKEMILILIAAQDATDESILFDTIEHGNMDQVKDLVLVLVKYRLTDLLHSTNDLNQNCLHLMVLENNCKMLKIFLNLGIDINQVDINGKTPLHLAVEQNAEKCIQELIDSENGRERLSLDAMNDDGFTALHSAVARNNYDLVKLLVEAGASIETKNPTTGNNVLHIAVEVKNPSEEIMSYFINMNEKLLHVENHSGIKVLQLAMLKKIPSDLIEYLKSFYEQTYTEVVPESDIESSDSEDELDTKVVLKTPSHVELFDSQCQQELCAIFDKNEKWRDLAMLMELEEFTNAWTSLPSPTQALLKHLETTKKSLDFIISICDMIDEKRAINVIDDMTARRFNR
ncbi:unnamed protein product [Diamesa tonsa]